MEDGLDLRYNAKMAFSRKRSREDNLEDEVDRLTSSIKELEKERAQLRVLELDGRMVDDEITVINRELAKDRRLLKLAEGRLDRAQLLGDAKRPRLEGFIVDDSEEEEMEEESSEEEYVDSESESSEEEDMDSESESSEEGESSEED